MTTMLAVVLAVPSRFAVKFVPFANGTILPWGWVIVALVVTSLFLITRRWRYGRAVCALLAGTAGFFVFALPVTAQLICGACIGCDPWWLEYFWICI